MKGPKINVQRNIANAWVQYEAKFGKPNSLATWTGTDVFTLLRHNGEWKIVSLFLKATNNLYFSG